MCIRDSIRDVASDDPQNPDRWMLHQAANDGFRGLFLVSFDGPSAAANGPHGLVILSNGDNDAMLFNCAMARAMLEALEPAGFDLGRVPDVAAGFDTTGMRQEEIVNLGFKGLVLDAFAEAPGFELG